MNPTSERWFVLFRARSDSEAHCMELAKQFERFQRACEQQSHCQFTICDAVDWYTGGLKFMDLIVDVPISQEAISTVVGIRPELLCSDDKTVIAMKHEDCPEWLLDVSRCEQIKRTDFADAFVYRYFDTYYEISARCAGFPSNEQNRKAACDLLYAKYKSQKVAVGSQSVKSMRFHKSVMTEWGNLG